MSVQCPLTEVKQTSRRKAATSVFDRTGLQSVSTRRELPGDHGPDGVP